MTRPRFKIDVWTFVFILSTKAPAWEGQFMDYEIHIVTKFRSVIQPLIPIVVSTTSSMSFCSLIIHKKTFVLPSVYALDVTGLAVSWLRVKPPRGTRLFSFT